MRKILFIIILMAVSLTMSGQHISLRLNNYRNNEILTMQRVDIDTDALLSRKGEWSLEDAELSKKRYKACYYLGDRGDRSLIS